MATCPRRSVLNAPDRPHDVRRAALEVQSAANALQNRVQPHSGSPARVPGGFGRALNHRQLDPMGRLARAISQIGRATANSVMPQQGPVGVSGGQGVGAGQQIYDQSPQFLNARTLVYNYEAPYTEPMDIPIPADFRPIAIIAGRIQDTTNVERYFRSGVSCDWRPSSTPNKVTLRSIDGMTVADLNPLQFTFIYFGY